jgi:hypothetical protein
MTLIGCAHDHLITRWRHPLLPKFCTYQCCSREEHPKEPPRFRRHKVSTAANVTFAGRGCTPGTAPCCPGGAGREEQQWRDTYIITERARPRDEREREREERCAAPPTSRPVFDVPESGTAANVMLAGGGGTPDTVPCCPGSAGRPPGPGSGGWFSPLLLMLLTTPLMPAVTAETTFCTTCWPAAGFGRPAGGFGRPIGFGSCAVSDPLQGPKQKCVNFECFSIYNNLTS